jgi:hypothetical protein
MVEGVMLVVLAHEEPHPVAVPENVAVTTQESRCVNFCENLKLFVCFGVLSIFEPKLLASHQILH